jgi:hypothetical protein
MNHMASNKLFLHQLEGISSEKYLRRKKFMKRLVYQKRYKRSRELMGNYR